jgi:nicotinamidase-related amidase
MSMPDRPPGMAGATDGGAPVEKAPYQAALLLIDTINDLVSDDGEALPDAANAIVEPLTRLRDGAVRAGLPVIYVNDNFELWRGGREAILDHCLRAESRGKALVEALRPGPNDFFLIKPQFSGFYATNLPVLLPRLGVTRLILAGVAADICVLFTAADAHMREYELWVPRDVVASGTDKHRDWALEIMTKSMGAETRPTDKLGLRDWLERR